MTPSVPRRVRVLDTRIIETREEISLVFGSAHSDSAAGREILIDSATQVILTPAAAKRLSQVIHDVLSRHESRYGVISLPSRRGSRNVPSLGNVPRLGPAEAISGTGRLISLVDALGIHYGIEHSFKISPGTIRGDRLLLGLNRNDIRGDAAEEMMRLCRDLDMPHRFRKIYREHFDQSNVVLFGYEGDEKRETYKAYLEFGGMFEKSARDFPEVPESFLLHLGFKWDAADNRKATLARYTCYPSLSGEGILNRVRRRFYPGQEGGAFDILRAIVDKAAGAMNPQEFLYLEVSEENNPRSSYDINMYLANLTLEELYPLLRDACRSWKIPPESFHRLYDPMKQRIFGHVSGGLDREGREFLTFYYGVAGSSR
ncbi:MAG: DUF3467 domain-containing protein [Syntrophales bacterium]|nr:DUF3467 domain-containing protein [Syntrophales bacterium]MCK9528454.1 DUF3467 domain-containing protein [Syntrophales bacterium]MDX9922477.1 hypothetical protein [Syntrophales bacterium]